MNEPQKFRKKPVEIEAIRYLPPGNCRDVWEFLGWDWTDHEECDESDEIGIDTLEGIMTAHPGDWIIRGVEGEFYPCKPCIFAATYEAVEQ